jgi:hypothetical protein
VSFSSCLFVFWFVAFSGFFWRLPSPVCQLHPVYTCFCSIASMWAPCAWSLTFIGVSRRSRAFPHWVCTPVHVLQGGLSLSVGMGRCASQSVCVLMHSTPGLVVLSHTVLAHDLHRLWCLCFSVCPSFDTHTHTCDRPWFVNTGMPASLPLSLTAAVQSAV